MEEALEAITEEVLDLFRKEYIRKYVYNSHGSNVDYHAGSGVPTYEFENAWDWTPIRRQVNSLVTELWYNPSRLTFDADTFKHGSIYSRPEDVRASLMDILNKTGYSSSLWLSVSRDTAYWEQFLIDMFDSGKLGQIINKHVTSKGFTPI